MCIRLEFRYAHSQCRELRHVIHGREDGRSEEIILVVVPSLPECTETKADTHAHRLTIVEARVPCIEIS